MAALVQGLGQSVLAWAAPALPWLWFHLLQISLFCVGFIPAVMYGHLSRSLFLLREFIFVSALLIKSITVKKGKMKIL